MCVSTRNVINAHDNVELGYPHESEILLIELLKQNKIFFLGGVRVDGCYGRHQLPATNPKNFFFIPLLPKDIEMKKS